MRIKAIVGMTLIIMSITINKQVFSEDILSINELKGEKKWIELKNLLIKVKYWGSPPSKKYKFLPDGKVLAYGYTVKEEFTKIGEWNVNVKKQYFYFKRPKVYIEGFYEGTYRSFVIKCYDVNDRQECQIMFYKKKGIENIVEDEEPDLILFMW